MTDVAVLTIGQMILREPDNSEFLVCYLQGNYKKNEKIGQASQLYSQFYSPGPCNKKHKTG
jgi:hypothetical protein